MSNFLLKIRTRNESLKKKLLFFSTVVVMFVIYLVWYFLSGITIGPIKYINGDIKEISGIELIFNTFENFFSNVVNNFIEVKDDFGLNIPK